jgi:hypothetical protein
MLERFIAGCGDAATVKTVKEMVNNGKLRQVY